MKQARELAEKDEYAKAILDTVTNIIDNKNYTQLYLILENYDAKVRFWENENGIPMPDFGLPFWCCPID